VRVGDVVHVSGTLGIGPDGRPPEGAYAQAVAALVRIQGALEALDATLADVGSLGGKGGLIAVAPDGQAAWGFTTPAMYRGMADASGRTVRVYSEEEER
jgi:beta-aspartyl-peptidase (threonine type)